MERNKLKQTAATIYVNEHHKGLDSVTQRTRSRPALSRVLGLATVFAKPLRVQYS